MKHNPTRVPAHSAIAGWDTHTEHLPRMKEKGWGRIIFIASESAVNIPVEMIHYGVSKTMQVAVARVGDVLLHLVEFLRQDV